MGDCEWSKVAKMQLFHELKQQFPTLSDSVVNDCIKENGHDKEICARNLHASTERRPSRGAFPTPTRNSESVQGGIMNQEEVTTSSSSISLPHRPAPFDFELRRPSIGCTRVSPINNHFISSTPISGQSNSGSFSSQEVFDDPSRAERAGFELNVNVECSPTKNSGFRSPPVASRRSNIAYELRPFTESYMNVNPVIQVDQPRSFTSVSLTLRPPSSDPQPPIDIRSQGSSLTYCTSSSDPRGFQSSVQISVAAARIRPPMAPIRPSSLIPPGQFNSLRQPAELSSGPLSQLSRPTITMSAPTTPLVPLPSSPTSSSATPSVFQPIKSLPSAPEKEGSILVSSNASEETKDQRQLIAVQLKRKERLAQELEVGKEKLEAMKKEVERLLRPSDSALTPEAYKQKLQNEISQLRAQCNRLTNEIDLRSFPGVPLGETNEEFYQAIYTGQPFVPRLQNLPPPLPAEPPAWQRSGPSVNREEREEPSWVCRMCTFNNHPLMRRCEQCDLHRILPVTSGETQDIHIRVTHHHNFSPRRTVHSWVV